MLNKNFIISLLTASFLVCSISNALEINENLKNQSLLLSPTSASKPYLLCKPKSTLNFTPRPPKNRIIAHRGFSELAPENTMASFKKAADDGNDWVEFDLMLTKDNDLVIFHDDKLNRTSNGSGFVHEHTIKDLRRIDAGSWFDTNFRGEKIPIFSEVLPELLALKLYLNIELKVPENATRDHLQRLVNRFVEIFHHSWPKDQPFPLVSSFEWTLLDRIRSEIPEMPLGYLADSFTAMQIEEIAKMNNVAIHGDYQHLTPEVIALAENLNIPVLAYTVNDPIKAKELLDRGIFAVFSDNPRKLQTFKH